MSYLIPLLVSCLVCTALGHDTDIIEKNMTLDSPFEILLKGPENFFADVGKGIQQEAADIKQPVEEAFVYIGSSQCKLVIKINTRTKENLLAVFINFFCTIYTNRKIT